VVPEPLQRERNGVTKIRRPALDVLFKTVLGEERGGKLIVGKRHGIECEPRTEEGGGTWYVQALLMGGKGDLKGEEHGRTKTSRREGPLDVHWANRDARNSSTTVAAAEKTCAVGRLVFALTYK